MDDNTLVRIRKRVQAANDGDWDGDVGQVHDDRRDLLAALDEALDEVAKEQEWTEESKDCLRKLNASLIAMTKEPSGR